MRPTNCDMVTCCDVVSWIGGLLRQVGPPAAKLPFVPQPAKGASWKGGGGEAVGL